MILSLLLTVSVALICNLLQLSSQLPNLLSVIFFVPHYNGLELCPYSHYIIHINTHINICFLLCVGNLLQCFSQAILFFAFPTHSSTFLGPTSFFLLVLSEEFAYLISNLEIRLKGY